MRITKTPEEINNIATKEGADLFKMMVEKYPCDKLENFDVLLNSFSFSLLRLYLNFTDGNIEGFIEIVKRILRDNAHHHKKYKKGAGND